MSSTPVWSGWRVSCDMQWSQESGGMWVNYGRNSIVWDLQSYNHVLASYSYLLPWPPWKKTELHARMVWGCFCCLGDRHLCAQMQSHSHIPWLCSILNSCATITTDSRSFVLAFYFITRYHRVSFVCLITWQLHGTTSSRLKTLQLNPYRVQ